jgi:hypothetical protein
MRDYQADLYITNNAPRHHALYGTPEVQSTGKQILTDWRVIVLTMISLAVVVTPFLFQWLVPTILNFLR